jgi:imidazoleglycerol-phosphate dehydratase
MADQSARTATVSRKTSETEIEVKLELDRNPGLTKQVIDISTGIGFLDHVRIL